MLTPKDARIIESSFDELINLFTRLGMPFSGKDGTSIYMMNLQVKQMRESGVRFSQM
jgi:hypothetical protein